MTSPKPIQCRACSQTLATISPQGLVSTKASNAPECSTCQQFTTLYDAMIAADQAYAPLMHKGDKHRGKQAAITKVNKAHMAFDNWLMGVEVLAKHDQEQQNGDEEDQETDKNLETETEQPHKMIVRAHSHSPTSERREYNHDQDATQAGQESRSLYTINFPHRPSPKRSHSTPTEMQRKRLKFSDSVEFRDDYRSYLELNRSHESYVPGRYAPPAGAEYWDTSGAEQSALKFSGVKRVKGGWVEVSPNDRKKRGSKKKGDKRRKFARSEDIEAIGEANALSQEEAEQKRPSPTKSRAERLGRRTRRSSGADLIEELNGTMAKGENNTDQSETFPSDPAGDKVSLPVDNADTITRQETDTSEAIASPEIESFRPPVLSNNSDFVKEHKGNDAFTIEADSSPQSGNKGTQDKKIELYRDSMVATEFPTHNSINSAIVGSTGLSRQDKGEEEEEQTFEPAP